MQSIKVLVTGSSGLIGSQAVEYFYAQGAQIFGIDNNMRADFFGIDGDTTWNLRRLQGACPEFRHFSIDIRDRLAVMKLMEDVRPGLIIHAAAQPSHDLAADRPFDDFDVNAVGTLNLLESTRRYSPDAVFIHMSTNKVYGDRPNQLPLKALATRWEYADPQDFNGVREDMSIDNCLHSLFGASKVAADVMAQEYGRYFGMRTCIFRGGCLTGASHSGAEKHGFLSYLFRAAAEKRLYTIYGYLGKQVRDQIHSEDVSRAMHEVFLNPRCGEVYNLGGCRQNSASVLECIDLVEQVSGFRLNYTYSDQNRKGDHICYISDMSKFRTHYPDWELTWSLPKIAEAIWKQIESQHSNQASLKM